jgi:hypothetical protein
LLKLIDQHPIVGLAGNFRGMNCMNAIDTNIVAYTFDTTAPVKQTLARQLLYNLVLKPHETILLWQAASNFSPACGRPRGKAY